MPSTSAFLQAILAAPEQDAPRLVYADWLEERGDPRGEFIRLQVALEHLPAGSSQRSELDRRARELLAKHEAEWIGDILRNRAVWRFRRGFVEHITMPAVYLLTYAGRIWECEPAVSVNVTDLNQYASAVALLPQLANLRRLNIGRNSVGDEALLPFAQSHCVRNLETLCAWGCRLGDESAIALAYSPILSKLRTVDLSKNMVRSRGAVALARSPFFGRIERLRVYHNRIGIDAADELRQRFGQRVML